MNHKFSLIVATFLAALTLPGAKDVALAGETRWVSYDTTIALSGTLSREFDMAFVDSDMSPLTDPKEVAKAVAEARRKNPVDESRPHDPSPHLILHLGTPISIRTQVGDDDTEERDVTEIDLNLLGEKVRNVEIADKLLGKARFRVSGKLMAANTVHHLRPVVMEVEEIKRSH